MKIKAIILGCVGIMSVSIFAVIDVDNHKQIVDIRKFGLEFQHNKQDEHDNTFWHQLAYDCDMLDDWSDIETKINKFKENNKDWLPNPLIENKNGKTAKKEAKQKFAETGNVICAALVVFFKQKEEGYLCAMALKKNRENMAIFQHLNHPNG